MTIFADYVSTHPLKAMKDGAMVMRPKAGGLTIKAGGLTSSSRVAII